MINLSDALILAKKIIVGILVFLIPAVLITGGLTFAARLLNPKLPNNSAAIQKTILEKEKNNL